MISFLAALALVVSASLVPGPAAHPAGVSDVPSPRPLVLVVHGRGHAPGDSAAFRRDVLSWLREGARRVTGSDILETGDVRLVWYSDLISPGRTQALCTRASARDGEISTFGALAMLAGSLLEVASSDTSTASPMLRGLAGEIRFFADPYTRCAAEQRVDAALTQAGREQRPVVLVAYSFGGLVAWSHLQQRALPAATSAAAAPREIYRLVTIGSPIASAGVRQLVFNDLRAAPALPTGVRTWVNVVDVNDPFAAPLFGRDELPASGPLEDAMINAGRVDPHDLRGYLRDPATTRAVVGGWCEAAATGQEGCRRLLARP